MALPVVNGAQVMCSFGAAPSALVVLPDKRTLVEGQPVATVMDIKPLLNVLPFGLCSSMANPVVIAATAAALGVLTPMPCVPVPVAPWTPGDPTALVGGMPVLTQPSTCTCAWGGVITVVLPGAYREQFD